MNFKGMDMNSWNIEDKEWMRQRRESWKTIKRKIDKLGFLEKEERKVLKNYYLLGEDNEVVPLSGMYGGALLELWLHPDKSDGHWNEVKNKIKTSTNQFKYDSYREFTDINSNLEFYNIDNELSFFDGLEEKLCYFIHKLVATKLPMTPFPSSLLPSFSPTSSGYRRVL